MKRGLMNTAALALLSLLASSAGFAQAGGPPPGACRFHPGEVVSGYIRITVRDPVVKVDQAVVRLTARIPAGGRMTPAGAYVAPPLPPIRVHLARHTLMHFFVRPHIVIEHYRSGGCQLRFDSLFADRSWYPQGKTDFTLRATVVAGGTRQVFQNAMILSCLDESVPVRLATGQLVPIEDIVAGDMIFDPATGGSLEVKKVIWGTEANEPMYRIGFGTSVGLFTGQHPIMTRRGLVPAASITRADSLLGADGAYHRVTILQVSEGNPARFVYNLEVDTPVNTLGDHLFIADGIVVGDNDLQQRLAAGEPKRGVKPEASASGPQRMQSPNSPMR